MTPEIQWDEDCDEFIAPCRRECEHMAWIFHEWGNDAVGLFSVTLRDMMLHGY